MTSTPLVSIVTPSFNQAKYLETTIRSVLNQDYGHIEYIVMDGGSTDGSIQILEKYDSKISYWTSQLDRGQADAINRGFELAKGELLAWLNSDDAYMPGAVREAVDAINNFPDAGMIYGDGIMVGEHLEVLDRHHYPQLTLVDLLSFEVLLQPAVFMRRSALEQVGYLDPEYNLILDHELWVRIASRYPIVHVPSYWALERTHPEAKTIAMAGQFVTEAERLIDDASRSPNMQEIIPKHNRRIQAGLGVFAARRLIDAGYHSEALLRITLAVFKHPATVLRYWYKWVQAFFSTLGLEPIFMWYRRTRRKLLYSGEHVSLE